MSGKEEETGAVSVGRGRAWKWGQGCCREQWDIVTRRLWGCTESDTTEVT